MTTVVDTYRVVRRQDMGGGRFREHGQLIPEAHLFFAPEHLLHTGEITEAPDVPEEEFRAAVQEFCPDQAEALYAHAGLAEGVTLEGAHKSPRATSMVPSRLPERANPKTVKPLPRLTRNKRLAGAKQEVTILATDAPPGAPTPGVEGPLVTEEIPVEPTEGAKGYFEDAGTVDPAALNEALTGTRPSDIATHDTNAAYKKHEAVVSEGEPVTGVAEEPADDLTGGVAAPQLREPEYVAPVVPEPVESTEPVEPEYVAPVEPVQEPVFLPEHVAPEHDAPIV